jgi:hypothetical protein
MTGKKDADSTMDESRVLNLTSELSTLSPEKQAEVIEQMFHLQPELRQRFGTQSELPQERQHVLQNMPRIRMNGESPTYVDRQVGSQMLGHGHQWRSNKTGRHSADHPDFKARSMRVLPTQTRQPQYSFSKSTRFPNPGFSEKNTLTYKNWETPGPGAYLPSRTPFVGSNEATGHPHMDGIAFGANHTFQWKDALGQAVNPVAVDRKLRSSPKYSFGRMRRCASDVSIAYSPISVKSDEGNLSPGPIYPYWTTFGIYGPT